MPFEYTPLLQTQRDLCALPPGKARFDEYIQTLRGSTADDMELPLSLFNPMGKQHIPSLLDDYLSLNADDLAAQTTAEANQVFADVPDQFRVALVLADDAKGGWTNRYTVEFEHRFMDRANHRRGWAVGLLWSSEPASSDTIRRATLSSIARAIWIGRHGYPQTLRAMLQQIRFVISHAGPNSVEFPEDELQYTREVLQPVWDTTIRSVQLACLFGDEAAKQLGYEPFGLSTDAGFALAASSLPL